LQPQDRSKEKEVKGMNKMMLILMVLGLSLVFLGGTALAYPPGYWEHYASQFPYAREQGSGAYRPMHWRNLEATELIGQLVNDRRGNYLGQVSDLVIDQVNGRVALVVLSNIPGFGNDQVSIPYGCFRMSRQHTLSVRFPDATVGAVSHRLDPDLHFLTQYPADSPLYSIPQPIDPNWVAEVYRTYGRLPYWTEKGERQPSAADLYKGTQAIAGRVESTQGEVDARISNFIIESTNGSIPLLVLSDVKGRGDSRVAVPFDVLKRMASGIFALNGTEYELASAPSFHDSNLNSRRYAEHLYRFFGMQPSWAEGSKVKAMDPYRWGGEDQDF
jgi:sporulation protein YlmC with PRC-barrel domain